MACPLFSLQSVYWERTVVIFGEQRSWAVLLFAFLSASSDCTSSVVYWPFAGSFLPRYISGMAVGEGLSGVVAALLSQLQYFTCKDPECTDFAFGPTQYFVARRSSYGGGSSENTSSERSELEPLLPRPGDASAFVTQGQEGHK